MQQADVRKLLNEALALIGGGGSPELTTYFSDECTFVVPGSPYRIDGLNSFAGASANFKEMEGVNIYVDVRQLHVVQYGDASLACGHVVSRFSLAGRTVSLAGKCTAVISNSKIAHLHMSNNVGGESEASSGGGRTMLPTDNDPTASQLRLMRWGSEEFSG